MWQKHKDENNGFYYQCKNYYIFKSDKKKEGTYWWTVCKKKEDQWQAITVAPNLSFAKFCVFEIINKKNRDMPL